MSRVFVLDTYERPLTPCHPAQARRLLTRGKASVFRRYPFTIILKEAVPDAQPAPLRLKLDPGSKTTGIALVNDASGQVVFAAEVAHRGHQVAQDLRSRRAIRRGRRNRHTRYRPARFLNRRRREGWLPPSLESRIANVLTWTLRLMRLAPVAAISQELVRFDTQIMQTPDISGVEYQQGTLAGYEVRHDPTRTRRQQPRQQSDAGVREVQRQEGHKDGGRVWPS
jgi:hypothetical protein